MFKCRPALDLPRCNTLLSPLLMGRRENLSHTLSVSCNERRSRSRLILEEQRLL